MQTAEGFSPRVTSGLSFRDRAGAIFARLGIGRYAYKIVPGLYCVGRPDPTSPVLVTANYKLTFDALRKELGDLDAWLLVIDTRGINVWCAAGKGLFSSQEVVRQVQKTRLAEIVSHRELVLPQLSATGASAHQIKRECGFTVIYGPVRAADLKAFFKAGGMADEAMRTVTFTLRERAVLIPVEIYLLKLPLAVTMLAALILSGLGPFMFSMSAALNRGAAAACATIFGVVAGAVIVPLLLPRLPWREFWIGGAFAGMAAGILNGFIFADRLEITETSALVMWTSAIASYLAMNFTGSTTYTSPSGVEKEMRKAIPVQAAVAAIAVIAWVAAPFLG